MANKQSPANSEEYKVKFWIINDQGFNEQQTKFYYFSDKASHEDAIDECIKEHQLLNKTIRVVNVTYQ